MAKRQRYFTLHGSSRDQAHMWATFLREGGLEGRLVDGRDLGDPVQSDPGSVFRGAHEYAVAQGFIGGYPTFLTKGTGFDVKFEIILLSDRLAEFVEYDGAKLDKPEKGDVGHFIRCFHRYSWHELKREQTAFPTFHERRDDDRTLYGAVQLRRRVGVYTRVYESELRETFPEDLAGRIRALQRLAVKRGFAACISSAGCSYAESEIIHNFNYHWRIRRLVEEEGWTVARVDPLGTQTDGEGNVHYAAVVVLEKEG